MRATLSILLFALGFQVGVLHAAGLDIGGVEVTLGMRQEAAEKALGSRLSLVATGNGYWLVLDSAGKGLGTIGFKQGRVVHISRDWINSSADEASRLAEKIFSLIANLAGDGAEVRISTQEVRKPDKQEKHVMIIFPHRMVSISIISGRSGASAVTVSEAILEGMAASEK